MSVVSYPFNNIIRLAGAYKDRLGVLFDPTAVSLVVEDPAGGKTTYVYGVDPDLVNDSVGNYHRSIQAAIVGRWKYRWEGEQNGDFGEEFFFDIRQSNIS